MVKTVLIVEDNPLNMTLFNEVLRENGYETVQSVDGKNTLQLAREHHPDLIVMDIQLPETSGLEYTGMLKADDELKNIPVLAVTAFALKGGVERILAAGCDDVVAKPISIPAFLESIAQIIK